MATYSLRRFSSPAALKRIDSSRLLALLAPFGSYFADRGIPIPEEADHEKLDYAGLVEVFMSPGDDTPDELSGALYYIHELATSEGMDSLLSEPTLAAVILASGDRTSPSDVAVHAWLEDPDTVKRKHAEQFLIRPRSFEYFRAPSDNVPFRSPAPETVSGLEASLDDWFEKKNRGRGCRVFIYEKPDGVWFLIWHGDPYRREGAIQDDGEPADMFYRPEKYDVLVFDPERGEIWANARSKGEKDLYRSKIGLHLFDHESFFVDDKKFTLEPLRVDAEAALVCTDITAMEWVILREIHILWGGPQGEVEIRKSKNLLKSLD